MKRMLLAAFSALYLSVSAQITVTNATFPVAGDTLRFAYDESPVGFNPATPPGGNQIWNFSTLSADNTDEMLYKAANSGTHAADFPGAELVLPGATGETYFNVTNSKMEVQGYAGADPAGFGLDVSTPFTPSLIERRSPMNFFDINSQQSNLNLTFPTDQPPLDALFAGLPVNVDSMRVAVTTNRVEAVDAWGTCQIPGGQYPVLRQKRTDYVSTGIEVYVSLFPGFGSWVDLSTLIGSGGGGGLGDVIGTDTTVTYRFYSGTEKEEIAVATMSNDLSSVERMRFKRNQVTTATPDINAPGNAGITAFPNPAIDWVRFDCTNLPQEDYTLKIFNIIGKVVWKENYQLSGTRSIRVELDHFKKGTYLYSLSDKKGNVIGTKRLVVLKP
ncbi:MAG: T9SS type A sorting domain-containing protein [Lewinellaceae bacterium]|nr:T9SS type A sorting domain-containing protein [Lewinellaceae bacterium]